MIGGSVFSRRAGPGERAVEGGKIAAEQAACVGQHGDRDQLGRRLDVGDADVFEGDHGQPPPQALPVEDVELVAGTAGDVEIAAPDRLLQGRAEQIRIGVRERRERRWIDGEGGWVVTVTDEREQQGRGVLHVTGGGHGGMPCATWRAVRGCRPRKAAAMSSWRPGAGR